MNLYDIHNKCNGFIVMARSVPFCVPFRGVREQFNAITSFVDASNVYGSTEGTANKLRAHYKGQLKVKFASHTLRSGRIQGLSAAPFSSYLAGSRNKHSFSLLATDCLSGEALNPARTQGTAPSNHGYR